MTANLTPHWEQRLYFLAKVIKPISEERRASTILRDSLGGRECRADSRVMAGRGCVPPIATKQAGSKLTEVR